MKHFLKGVFTLISIVCFSINTHGFVGDTLVHTESGMKPIKSIYQNYSPYEISLDCCDENIFSCFQQRMIKAAEGECQHKIRITFENNGSAFAIECAPYQSFYVVGKRKSGYAINGTAEAGVINCIDWLISDTLLGPSYAGKRVAAECGIGAWTRACDIKVDDYLFCKKGWHRWVSEVALIEAKTTMYTLEVEHAHTYFVGLIQVLAHNSPLLLAGAALSWGETTYFGTAALASMWAAAQATGELLVPNQITYYAAGTSIPTETGIEAAEIVLSENIKKAIPAVTCLALTGYFTYQCIQEIQRVYYGIHYDVPYVTGSIRASSGISNGTELTLSPLMNAINSGRWYYSEPKMMRDILSQEKDHMNKNQVNKYNKNQKRKKNQAVVEVVPIKTLMMMIILFLKQRELLQVLQHEMKRLKRRL